VAGGEPREHQIEDDEVRVTRAGAGDALGPRGGDGDVEPLALQRRGDREGEVGVVFDDEDARDSPPDRDASTGSDTFTGVYSVRDSVYADVITGSDTNGNTLDDAEVFSLSGGNDFVGKPFNVAELAVTADAAEQM